MISNFLFFSFQSTTTETNNNNNNESFGPIDNVVTRVQFTQTNTNCFCQYCVRKCVYISIDACDN